MPLNTCNITGTLFDSSGAPLQAELTFQTNSLVSDSGNIILPYLNVYTTGVDGVVDVDVPVTEPQKVGMTISIKPLSVAGATITFTSAIPDQTSVPLEQLLPTTFATDRAANSAIRVARELLTNDTLVPLLASGFKVQVSDIAPDPNTTEDGVLWANSTQGLLYSREKGIVNQWRTDLPATSMLILDDTSASKTVYGPIPAVLSNSLLFLGEVVASWSVSGIHDNSNRYTFRVGYLEAGNTTPVWLTGTQSTFTVNTVSGNAEMQEFTSGYRVLFPSDVRAYLTEVTKIGVPGPLTLTATCYHQTTKTV